MVINKNIYVIIISSIVIINWEDYGELLSIIKFLSVL